MRKPKLETASPPRKLARSALCSAHTGLLALLLCGMLALLAPTSSGHAQSSLSSSAAVSSEQAARLEAASPPRLAPPLPAVSKRTNKDWSRFARAIKREGVIWSDNGKGRYPIGAVRLGGLVRVNPIKGGARCKGGWYAVEPMGYACAAEGWRIGKRPPPVGQVLKAPDRRKVLPYTYVKAHGEKLLRFGKQPSAAQRRRALSGDSQLLTALEGRPLEGTYFLAIDRERGRGPNHWLLTLEGNFIHVGSIKRLEPSRLRGEALKAGHSLPMAFVIEDGAQVSQRTGGTLKPAGSAERYARVPLRTAKTTHGHVRMRDGRLLRAADVRVAARVKRPQSIADGERWIHIDLKNQTLVAYEDDRPVYATLISSGLPGKNTPNGLYRARYKHASITMRGSDEDGPYEVQEVPWVFFFEGAYAVHGAYWHDTFGNPRSHGCVNVAPADARWLFDFVSPELPAGWHSAFNAGTHVYLTGSGEEPPPASSPSS